MNVSAWAEQRARYSRARRGRYERGAQLAECALIQAMAYALDRRESRSGAPMALMGAVPVALSSGGSAQVSSAAA